MDLHGKPSHKQAVSWQAPGQTAGLHEADAQQPRLREVWVIHPAVDGRPAGTLWGRADTSAPGTAWRDSGLWDSPFPECPQPPSTVEADLSSAMPTRFVGPRQSVRVWKPHLTFCRHISASVQYARWPCQSRSRLPGFQSWLFHLPAVDVGWVTDHRPPLFAQLRRAEAWRIAGDATSRALRAAPAWRSDRPTERLMITMCGVRGLAPRSNLFFLSLPSFWGIPHWTSKFSALCSWTYTGVQKLSPHPSDRGKPIVLCCLTESFHCKSALSL